MLLYLQYLLSCGVKNTLTVSFKVHTAVSMASSPEHWPVSRKKAALTLDMCTQIYILSPVPTHKHIPTQGTFLHTSIFILNLSPSEGTTEQPLLIHSLALFSPSLFPGCLPRLQRWEGRGEEGREADTKKHEGVSDMQNV